MKFLNGVEPSFDLTYSDVFMVPNKSNVGSRMNVNLSTPDKVGTNIPIAVANMSAVAGKRMAESVARRGGIVILPQDMPDIEIHKTISYTKSRHPVFETPVKLKPEDRIQQALNLINKRAHGAVIIIDDDEKPVGIFTEHDAKNHDLYTRLGDVMSTDLVTFGLNEKVEDMFAGLIGSHIDVAPVTKHGKLIGVVTSKGAVRSGMYKPALDSSGKLLIGTAIGINGDVAGKASYALEQGSDVLVVDTAHGHQDKMSEAIKKVRQVAGKTLIVAGNVVTAQATTDLIEAGADIVKVGVGPGAMCTTRMMTGVGRPQFSAVLECSAIARQAGKHIWADGGIRHPRDVALALAAGASSTMFASWFAGTYESVADIHTDNEGRPYKESFGMASRRAVTNRTNSRDAYIQSQKQFFEEGVSTSKMYINPETPGVEDIIDQIVAGVRSSLTYSGALNIDEFYDKAIVGIQSSSGFSEGRPLPTSW